MQRADEVIDMCNKLVQNVYAMYSNRDESINSEIARMTSKIEEVLLENKISPRARQVIIEKLLGETANNISKTLETKREDIYSQMRYIVKKYYEEEYEIEEETAKQGKTKAMLEEQNEASKISTTKLDDIFQKAISNAITYLAQIGIPDDVLAEIKVRCGEIENNAISAIENDVSVYDKGVKQVIEETLGDIHKQTLVGVEEKQDENPWELSLEEEAAFREGEKTVLSQYEAGELPNRETTQKEEYNELRADDIF